MSEPSFLAGRFLPYRILPDWLGETQAGRLLAFCLAAEARFKPTRLADQGTGRLDAVVRQSSVLKDLGAFAGPLRKKALALQDGLETAFDMTHTPANSTQMEMVAHGDGVTQTRSWGGRYNGYCQQGGIEVIERDPPPGAEPVHWRLLTTHDVPDARAAWRIVGWYKQRWTIEQLFRVLKSQGLQLEDSQLETAERLLKLAAIATQAAAVILQLVQARDGRTPEPADIVFSAPEIKTLDALVPTLEGKTALQKNPYPSHSLAWAAWVIAKLGGWDGYPRSTPPGPITFKLGIDRFKSCRFLSWFPTYA